jgi:hypothetical protein
MRPAKLITAPDLARMTYPHAALKLATVGVLLTGGCKEAPVTRHSPPDPSGPATVASVDAAAISLHLQSPSEVEPGEAVPLLLIARNDSRRALYLGTGDSTTTFDIRVVDRFGKTVWKRMHDRESLASLHERTLAPGQDLRFADTWDQRTNEGALVPAGIYHVQGTLDAQGETDLETTPKRLKISVQP